MRKGGRGAPAWLAKNLLLGARGEGQLRWNPKALQGKGFAACVPTLSPSSAALLAALLGIAGIGFLRKRRLAPYPSISAPFSVRSSRSTERWQRASSGQ